MNTRLMDRPDWFAPVQETVMEPERPIIDPHHHLWNVNGHRYLAEEFLQEFSGGHNVRATVYLECHSKWFPNGPDVMKPVGETVFVVEQAKRAQELQQGIKNPCNVAAGIVNHVDLAQGDAVQDALDAHSEASDGRFRGIRHAVGWDPDPKVHNSHTNPPAHQLSDGQFRRGLRHVVTRNLAYDVYHYFHQFDEVIDLARAMPDATIVCNHLGGYLGVGPHAGKRSEIFTRWRDDITRLAARPNVMMKLGGMAMRNAGLGFHAAERPMTSQDFLDVNGDWFHHAIQQFGPDRCMFESNFPMDKVSISYTNLWNAFKKIAAQYSEAERDALCHDTAARVYRLETN